MKIIDIRKTQSGWIIDVLFTGAVLSFSSHFDLVKKSSLNNRNDFFIALMEYANTDPEHIAISQDAIHQERDTMDKEWKETYFDIRGGL